MHFNNETVLARIEQQKPGLLLGSETGYDGVLNVETSREKAHELLQFLRDDSELNYHFLTTLCGMHYPDNTG
ncbi:MAG TPA: hypothetical protein PLW66_10460, partial [Saprospiraceae bacterium]|nr:hypothetical protein [Saprospiraceae bacterium]